MDVMLNKKWVRTAFRLMMALVILLAPLQMLAAAESFSDVPSGVWYETYVNKLADDGIIKGHGDNRYEPGRSLSRAEVITILGNIVLSSDDLNQYKDMSFFSDVPKDMWYAEYINWGSEAGIIAGYGDGSFGPDAPIRRQELAVMLAKFSGLMGYSLPAAAEEKSFSDKGAIDSWAVDSVKKCQTAGIFSGDDYNNFNPKDPTRRSEAAAAFHHFLELSDNSAYTVIRKRISGVYVTGVSFDASSYTGGVAMGYDRVNGREEMSSMVSRTGAKFAVNAAFFDMNNSSPNGTIISDGDPVTIDERFAPHKTSFIISESGQPSIQNISVNQKLTLERDGEAINSLDNVSANRPPTSQNDPTRIMYNHFWGNSMGVYARDALAIDSSGYVTDKGEYIEDMNIPEWGSILYQRSRREYEGTFFDSAKIGDKISEATYYEGYTGETALSLSVASGPRIVKGGAVYGDSSTYSQEGLGAGDIVSGSAKRVAIGVNGNRVIMITVSGCTMSKLSEIMAGAGCTDALNLDGGGSTGLYCNGEYFAMPSRQLNNMIYFK